MKKIIIAMAMILTFSTTCFAITYPLPEKATPQDKQVVISAYTGLGMLPLLTKPKAIDRARVKNFEVYIFGKKDAATIMTLLEKELQVSLRSTTWQEPGAKDATEISMYLPTKTFGIDSNTNMVVDISNHEKERLIFDGEIIRFEGSELCSCQIMNDKEFESVILQPGEVAVFYLKNKDKKHDILSIWRPLDSDKTAMKHLLGWNEKDQNIGLYFFNEPK